MVEKESYLLELSRYVVLNPVRAGMVADAADYPWSSYPAMLPRSDQHPPAPHPAWLETDFVLRQFGTGRRRAVAGYVDFVRAGVGLPSVWEGLRGQVFLGSDAFVEAMTRELDMEDPKLRDVPRVQRRPPPKALAPLIESMLAREADADGIAPRAPSRARDAAMAAAYATGHHTLRAIADAFGVHEATVSRALQRTKGNGSSKERGL